MPESLHWNHAVKGALVVIRGCVRVSNLPEIDRRARYAPSEAQQLRMRVSGAAGKICERDFDDAESLRVCLDQDFLRVLRSWCCEDRGWRVLRVDRGGIR